MDCTFLSKEANSGQFGWNSNSCATQKVLSPSNLDKKMGSDESIVKEVLRIEEGKDWRQPFIAKKHGYRHGTRA